MFVFTLIFQISESALLIHFLKSYRNYSTCCVLLQHLLYHPMSEHSASLSVRACFETPVAHVKALAYDMLFRLQPMMYQNMQ